MRNKKESKCRICGSDAEAEVMANKQFHSMAAVCNSCLSIISEVSKKRESLPGGHHGR